MLLLSRRHRSRAVVNLETRVGARVRGPHLTAAPSANTGVNGVFSSERGWVRELLPLGALSALLTLIAAGSAVLALSQTVRTGHELGALSQAQRYHQDADMMHDALRADVAVAQRLGSGGSPAARADLLRLTGGHGAPLPRDPAPLAEAGCS